MYIVEGALTLTCSRVNIHIYYISIIRSNKGGSWDVCSVRSAAAYMCKCISLSL